MHYRNRGFTLIEVMVTIAIVAILASIALPSYRAYVIRSKVPAGLNALTAYQMRMEQHFQDASSYADTTGKLCWASISASVDNFTLSCAYNPTAVPPSYTATATGSGSLTGFAYSVDDRGVRRTLAHPQGVPSTNCWTTRGAACDS